MPPAVTGRCGTSSIGSASKMIKAALLLNASRICFACKSSKKGINIKAPSISVLSFKKTDTLVIARMSNLVRGSKNIYTIPAFSKCFFSNFFPIIPPIIAHTTVPAIIAGTTHRLAPIALMTSAKDEKSPFLRINASN